IPRRGAGSDSQCATRAGRRRPAAQCRARGDHQGRRAATLTPGTNYFVPTPKESLMSRKVIVTCAVTGGSAAVLAKHPDIPKTPTQIAQAAIAAAKASAAVVHIHVRDQETV